MNPRARYPAGERWRCLDVISSAWRPWERGGAFAVNTQRPSFLLGFPRDRRRAPLYSAPLAAMSRLSGCNVVFVLEGALNLLPKRKNRNSDHRWT